MPTRFRSNWRVQLPIVFGVIVASFLAAMLVTQWQLLSVGRTSLEIADSTAPSIEYLANARGEMQHLEAGLADYLDDAKEGAPPRHLHGIERSRQALDASIAAYLQLPVEPAEQRLWGDILRTKDAFNGTVERFLAAVERRDYAAAEDALNANDAAGDALGAAITRDIELNASRSHSLALDIARDRRRSTAVAFALAGLCAAITIAGATALRRVMRRHSELVEEHRRLEEVRASELEQFAGRVAHDILSPLNVVGLAVRSVSMPGTTEPMREQLGERAGAAIKRIDRLVNGLLAFAVAGAEPEEGAHADVEATVADLERDLRESAVEAGAELHVDVKVSHPVACNPGMLTSIVSNLARNAIKYIGEGATRRIDVRAFETRNVIRIEVQDTGPGLLPDMQARVFEPYVRGPNAPKGAGIGLGLATVKRIVVAHGGRVGVRSVVGEGCTFWVELPEAEGELAPRPAFAEPAKVVH
jgi:signal transduction histidine kinase